MAKREERKRRLSGGPFKRSLSGSFKGRTERSTPLSSTSNLTKFQQEEVYLIGWAGPSGGQ